LGKSDAVTFSLMKVWLSNNKQLFNQSYLLQEHDEEQQQEQEQEQRPVRKQADRLEFASVKVI